MLNLLFLATLVYLYAILSLDSLARDTAPATALRAIIGWSPLACVAGRLARLVCGLRSCFGRNAEQTTPRGNGPLVGSGNVIDDECMIAQSHGDCEYIGMTDVVRSTCDRVRFNDPCSTCDDWTPISDAPNTGTRRVIGSGFNLYLGNAYRA